MVMDPVCGLEIDPETAAEISEHEGVVYYFCSLPCKDSFEEAPEKFILEEPSAE